MSSDQINEANEENKAALVMAEGAVGAECEYEDPIATATRLRSRFHSWEVGHHAELHSILQEMYGFGVRLDQDVMAHIAVVRQDYFRINPPRPKKIAPMKAAVFSTMTPTTENAKDRARKYTKILELFQKSKLDERLVVELIERCGGIENILANLSKAVRTTEAASDGAESIALSAAVSPEDDPDDESPTDAIGPSESPDSDKALSPDQALYEALTNGEPSTETRKSRATIPVDLSKDLVVDVGEAALRNSLLKAEKARSPQTYLMDVTVWPPDENGLFQVCGVFRDEIEDSYHQEDASGRDEARAVTAVSTVDEAAEPPVEVAAPIPGDNGLDVEAANSLTNPDDLVAECTSAGSISEGQAPQPPDVIRLGSSRQDGTPTLQRGNAHVVNVSPNKAKPQMVVERGRNSNDLSTKGAYPQAGASRPDA